MERFVACVLVVVGVACANAGVPRLADDEVGDAGPDVTTIDACMPTTEKCNDIDDDCDLVADELFTTKGQTCTLGQGACEVSGHVVCKADGSGVECSMQPGAPTSETCDGVDNDCDGKVDEDFHVGMPCDGSDTDSCADGVFACTSMTASACNDGPDNAGEICDGNDNDCDGHTDEGFGLGAPCDGTDTDACNEGTIVCAAGGGTKCSDNRSSTTELCNGVDDDCKNGIDDPFPVGTSCQVGLGMCLRSGQMVCTTSGSGVQCNATAGTPLAELCGNGVDEDCNGTDATCPANDLPAGAIDISAGGTFTADLSAAHDDNWTASTATEDCGDQGGRDVFYQFTLPAPEVVYFNTFGASFDSVVRVFAGSCTAIGALQRCGDDACATTRSHGAVALAAGTYCLVVDQFSSATTAGAASLVFKRGGRDGIVLPAASGSVAGTTTGKTDLSVATCEANSHQPDVAYAFPACPGALVSANTCSGTAFDAILSLRAGTATGSDLSCSDDVSGCGNGLQPKIINASVSAANLGWLIVDGFGTTGNGAFTMTYAIQ